MVEKDNYATTPYTSEGATGGSSINTYMSNNPIGNVPIYDLDTVVPPIERIQIVPNVPNLAPSIPSTTPAISEVSETTTTIAPISDVKKPNYLIYGGALAIGLVAYVLLKKK